MSFFRSEAEPSRNRSTEFLLWLLMVKLVMAEDEAAHSVLETAKEYFKNTPDTPAIIISVTPHTGHPDSLYILETLKKLLPEAVTNLLLVAAEDSWGSSFKQAVANWFFGTLALFDRKGASESNTVMRKELVELKELLKDSSLLIYPEGSRDEDATARKMPLLLANMAKRPVLMFTIENGKGVLPKVDGKVAFAIQVARRLGKRIWHVLDDSADIEVVIRAVDFLPHELEKKERERRFFAGHGVEVANPVDPPTLVHSIET